MKVPEQIGVDSISTETQLRYAATITAVAAIIEPPLTRKEISRIVSMSGIHGINALLNVNRTKDTVWEVIATSPSDCAAAYVQRQFIPEEVIERMVASPDPLIRREACLSGAYVSMKDGDTLLALLATDPDPYVRYALLDPQAGFSTNMLPDRTPSTPDQYTSKTLASRGLTLGGSLPQIRQHPELLDIYVNDPDYDTAVKALDVMPMNRRTMASLAEVRNPERLQNLRDHYQMMPVADSLPYGQMSVERNTMVKYLDRLIESRSSE